MKILDNGSLVLCSEGSRAEDTYGSKYTREVMEGFLRHTAKHGATSYVEFGYPSRESMLKDPTRIYVINEDRVCGVLKNIRGEEVEGIFSIVADFTSNGRYDDVINILKDKNDGKVFLGVRGLCYLDSHPSGIKSTMREIVTWDLIDPRMSHNRLPNESQ